MFDGTDITKDRTYEKIAESAICKDALSKLEEVEEFLRQIEISLGIEKV